MTVLITGASGFIGTSVLKALVSESFDLHAVYNSSMPKTEAKIKWHKVNLLDAGQVDFLFEKIKPEYLIQLAWCTGQGSYWTDEANLEWLSANLAIARSFVKYGGKRCLFAGTSAEYDWSFGNFLDEVKTPLKPLKLYGGAKLALFWALTRYFEQTKVDFVWARFFNPFGEGEDHRRLIPKTCLRLLNDEQINFDAALSERDFLHIDDVGDAVVNVLKGAAVGALNIGSGTPISVRNIVTMIARNYGRLKQISFSPTGSISQERDMVVANTDRLKKELGWQPVKMLEERINETCQWWNDQYKLNL
jgi:nucleoside-diphosphate-sugar epimerase